MASDEVDKSSIPIVFDECESSTTDSDTNNNINNDNDNEDNRIKEGIDNRLMKCLLDSNNKSNRFVKSGSISTPTSNRSRASKLLMKKELDSVSIGNCNSLIENRLDDNQKIMKIQLVEFLSIMYALILVVIGAIIAVANAGNPHNELVHIFGIIVKLISVGWIGFFHWDIQNYKKWAVEYLKPDNHLNDEKATTRSLNSESERLSIMASIIFDTYNNPASQYNFDKPIKPKAYRFSHGKHSGNFYLKSGMIVFCMGSIIHQGVNLSQQIYHYAKGSTECRNAIVLLAWLIRGFSSFYQLYFAYKYGNIIINRYKNIARFALMHLVGSSITFWFSTIIEEAIEDYVVKVQHMNSTYNYTTISDDVLFKEAVSMQMYCRGNALINTDTMEALPYLYPFSIEYNIILASIWYLIWTKIGQIDNYSHGHSINESVHPNGEIDYKSALSINVDCHASNLGLFCGLSTLLVTLTTMIIFFATTNHADNGKLATSVFTAQLGILTILSFLVIPIAYQKIRQLDIISRHHLKDPSIAMDDVLVLIPLPFYFVHYILSIIAEVQEASSNGIFLIVIYILIIVQALIQSIFIVDGKRRCSNSKRLRFTKPGRGLITFAIILNITLWILNTFERKSVDKYYSPHNFYGKFIWMIITHTTLPLILFYRFHSSVCLSDIWKHAYEKDENH